MLKKRKNPKFETSLGYTFALVTFLLLRTKQNQNKQKKN